jgi:hypothetical protein
MTRAEDNHAVFLLSLPPHMHPLCNELYNSERLKFPGQPPTWLGPHLYQKFVADRLINTLLRPELEALPGIGSRRVSRLFHEMGGAPPWETWVGNLHRVMNDPEQFLARQRSITLFDQLLSGKHAQGNRYNRVVIRTLREWASPWYYEVTDMSSS